MAKADLPRRAEYLGPEKRRPMVLEAAQEIFAEGGFADASMSAIAERAGVSKAVLYDCFPGGKQEIYISMLDRTEQIFLEHMIHVLDRALILPLEQALREGLLAFLSYAEVNPLGFRIIFGEPGTADPELAKRASATREMIVDKMWERTKRMLGRAGLPVTPVAQIYNRSVVAIAEELAHWILKEPQLKRDEVVEAVVLWLMKGFERIIPGEAWKMPPP